MSHNRCWNILSWNVRGLNSQSKWDHICNKISESSASIVCLQETKRDMFDPSYISKFCPCHLNKFAFVPFVGASGGILTIWNDRLFHGDVVQENSFALSIKFHSTSSGSSFHLSNIYGPSAPLEKGSFYFLAL